MIVTLRTMDAPGRGPEGSLGRGARGCPSRGQGGRWASLLGLVGLLALDATAAQAAPPTPPVPGLRVGNKPIPPGSWVRYSYYHPRKGVLLLRLAALERIGKAQWFELSFTFRQGQTLTMKTLLEGSMGKPKRVLRSIVQPPGQVPLILPQKLAAKQLPKLDSGSPGKVVGRGPLTVPAGRFKATHYRRRRKGKVEEAWLTDAIPGWPLLRYRAGKLRIDLVAHGKGARSAIVGTPVKLDPRFLTPR